jgi:hypothetical protein
MSHAAALFAFAACPLLAQNEAQPPRVTAPDRQQEQQPEKKAPRAEPLLLKLASVIGTDVVNSKQEKLGRIDEILFDTQNGKIHDAVLALAGNHYEKRVAVRWDGLAWDPLTRKCLYERTREELERAPAWKPEQRNADRDARDSNPRDSNARDSNPRDRDLRENVKDQSTVDASAQRQAVGGLMAATRLNSMRVSAGTDDLGTPSDVYTELRTGSMAFLTVTLGDVLGIGGKSYVVPWGALSLQSNSDQKSVLRIASMDRKQLENAPRLQGKDDVQNPAYRGRLYQFFGVRVPEYEPDHDLLGKADPGGH